MAPRQNSLKTSNVVAGFSESFLLGSTSLKLNFFLSTSFQDPEVMAAFSDVSKNPANISKYQNNPKIMAIINKLSSKFGAPPQP